MPPTRTVRRSMQGTTSEWESQLGARPPSPPLLDQQNTCRTRVTPSRDLPRRRSFKPAVSRGNHMRQLQYRHPQVEVAGAEHRFSLGRIRVCPEVRLALVCRDVPEQRSRITLGAVLDQHGRGNWSRATPRADQRINDWLVLRQPQTSAGRYIISYHRLAGLLVDIVTDRIAATTTVRLADARRH